MTRAAVAGVAAALLLAGAGAARPVAAPRLIAPHRCPDAPAYTCWTLRVPLDRSGRRRGTLALRVAVRGNRSAPRGTLLALTGGPGQPGEPFAAGEERILGPAVLRDYRVVLLDQRGTGAGALQCPELQRAMGPSDLYPAPASAVRACARELGAVRNLYGTDDVVADLDDLRRALGTPRWTLDGISYGTYVAERYALAHPRNVRALVLDSVVPHDAGFGLVPLDLRATARVLRLACRKGCTGDPVADLAAVVRQLHDGPQLYDALVLLSVFDPTFRRFDVPGILHDARGGRTARLTDMLARVRRVEQGWKARDLSQGLHASALCGDFRFPWGSSASPVRGREAALRRATARVRVSPFDRATLRGNGIVRQCLPWAPTPATPFVRGPLPAVPTLLLEGELDLSAPIEWARRELAQAPRGRLVVVHGTGHSVQTSPLTDAGRAAVRRFLLG